jgi:hypothetical protein
MTNFRSIQPTKMALAGSFISVGLVVAGCAAAASNGQLVKPIDSRPGLSGTVLRVTTLASDGPGSLRSALEDRRPRLVVFEVGGVIDLQGKSLVIRQPDVTVAGQTAPAPGITLIRGSLIVETHDVAIEHIAVRSGNSVPDDALGARRSKSPVYNVLFDHCSATWAVDENLSVSGPADSKATADPDATSHDVTLRSCLIAEGLSRSVHQKGEHSKGTLIHDGVRNVTITGSLYAHNRERNPRLKGGTSATIAGNVMYDWGNQCIGVGARGNDEVLSRAEATITGNVAIPGPDTRSKVFVKHLDEGGKVVLRDNVAPFAIPDNELRDRESTIRNAERVLRTAGSRPAQRDPIDARIVQSVIDGTGKIIDSQDDVGGYPVRAETRRAVVVPDENRGEWLRKLSQELSTDGAIDTARFGRALTVER